MSADLGRRHFALPAIGKGELATAGFEFVRRLVGGRGAPRCSDNRPHNRRPKPTKLRTTAFNVLDAGDHGGPAGKAGRNYHRRASTCFILGKRIRPY
jgi:hypothetical protein